MSAGTALAGVDVRGLLFERLGLDGSVSPEDALRQAAGDDPLMQALLQSFQRSADDDALEVDFVDEDAEVAPGLSLAASVDWLAEIEAGYERAREDIARLERRLGNMADDVSALREINATLAAALGACESCWGDDRGCLVCHGRGAPGAVRPEPRLFRELVMPAVRRVQRDHATGRPRPDAPVQSTHGE